MIRTVLLNTGSSPNIEWSWIWDKYSLFTDRPYVQRFPSCYAVDKKLWLRRCWKVLTGGQDRTARADGVWTRTVVVVVGVVVVVVVVVALFSSRTRNFLLSALYWVRRRQQTTLALSTDRRKSLRRELKILASSSANYSSERAHTPPPGGQNGQLPSRRSIDLFK